MAETLPIPLLVKDHSGHLPLLKEALMGATCPCLRQLILRPPAPAQGGSDGGSLQSGSGDAGCWGSETRLQGLRSSPPVGHTGHMGSEQTPETLEGGAQSSEGGGCELKQWEPHPTPWRPHPMSALPPP